VQLNRCPICHNRISLEALAQDEAGRELLSLLAKLDTEAGTGLVAYLGLFRSNTRDLANDRALKLAREVLELAPCLTLAPAMRQTVEQIRAKGGKPLSNHNYLKRVLEDSVQSPSSDSGHVIKDYVDGLTVYGPNKKASKTAQAFQALQEFGDGE